MALGVLGRDRSKRTGKSVNPTSHAKIGPLPQKDSGGSAGGHLNRQYVRGQEADVSAKWWERFQGRDRPAPPIRVNR